VFALGSSILLLLTGAFLYIGFNTQLEDAVDQALRDRAADITLDLHEGNLSIRPGEPFVVLLEPNGQVIDATVTTSRRSSVLTARELARARDREVVVDRRDVTGLGDRGRLLARPEQALDGRTVIVVVGESLDTVVRARKRLGLLLGAASPALIAAIAWCGWVLVGAALRPVRRLTEQAAAISLREGGQRLAQPPGDDEIALLGRTLNAMLDRVETSLAHERAFIDDASHELRTPISILHGELELAFMQPSGRNGLKRSLASALQEAERLGRLTDDLLVLARADRGHLPSRREPVDVLEATRRVASRHQRDGGPAVEVTGEPVTVAADPGALERVVDNLVANAARHAANVVRVSVDTDDGRARLVVADDGQGFPAEFLPIAFDRFSRADADRGRDHGGTGLGLAIVDALVRADGGKAEVGNGEPLGGARVTVWLPLAPELASAPAGAATERG
jgi:signal transduction histidine kinase